MVFLRFPSPITVGNPSFSSIIFPVKATFIEHLEVDSYGFPMVFAFFFDWNLHLSWIFPWFFHDFPIETSIYRGFPMIFPWFSHGFPIKTSIFPWFSHKNLHFPMVFLSGFKSQVFPRAPRRDLRLGLDLGGRGGFAEAPGPRLCLGWRVFIMGHWLIWVWINTY